MFDESEALEFFDQLGVFSKRVYAHYNLSEKVSQYGGEWKPHRRGAIIHFTADPDPIRVAKWLIESKYQSKTSAHAIVCDGWVDEWRQYSRDLSWVRDLPVPILEVRPHTHTAWHATWVNNFTYGIENINPGRMVERGGKYFWWKPRDSNSKEYTSEYKGPHEPIKMFDQWWIRYPIEQLQANVLLLQMLDGIRRLEIPLIVGHEQVQGVATLRANGQRLATDKRDPGPHYPLEEVRKEIAGDPVKDWQALYKADVFYGRSWRDGLAIEHYRMGTMEPTAKQAWDHLFVEDARKIPTSSYLPTQFYKLVLRVLGYHIRFPKDVEWAPDELESLKLFQRMTGVKEQDLSAGTRIALYDRLIDRGFIKRA